MADFDASTIVSGNTADLAELIRVLQSELPTKPTYFDDESSIDSVTGSSFTTIESETVTVKADECVEIEIAATWSHDTANDTVAFSILRDGVSIVQQRMKVKDTDASATDQVSISIIDMNVSGNRTYTLGAAVTGGSGTLSVGRRNLTTKVMKKRSS